MDRETLAIYEREAARYASRRGPDDAGRAATFGASIPAGAWRLDLGCGPGFHLPLLGTPALAADASAAMLGLAHAASPSTPAVRADLAALPLRTASMGGVWTHKCLQHVPAGALPLALAELRRVLHVGGRLDLQVFRGQGEWVSDDRSDLPGRRFTLWEPDELADVVRGAGFTITSVEAEADSGGAIRLSAIRERSLADIVGPGMRLLVCGLNPSLYAADAGVGFARPGNRFWPAMQAAGLADRPNDALGLLRDHHIGMTDLVKRATVGAAELTAAEYRDGLDRVTRICARHRPGAVVFVGLAGWRAARDRTAVAGWQERRLGATPVYLMPSSSGLNTHCTVADLAAHLRAATQPPD